MMLNLIRPRFLSIGAALLAAVWISGFPVAAIAEKKVIVPEGLSRSSSPLSPAIQTSEFVYVSGMVGRDAAGNYARGDVAAQTRQTLQNIKQTLSAAGLGMDRVVSTNVYIADTRQLETADSVYREFFPSVLPARTVLEALLMAPDALIEISAIAARAGTTIEAVTPDGWPAPSTPHSYAVRAGKTLFLSALRPIDPASNSLAGTTIEAQTEQALKNQESILKAAGMTFADLVYSRIYLADPADYEGLNKVYRQFVSAVPPARATVNPRLDDASHLIQIQSAAVEGSGEGRPSGEGITSPIHSYSVKSGNTLYITGMTGRRPDGTFASGDIRAQTRQALATIEEQLRKHGMTFADVVDSIVWLRDSRDFAGMNDVYREIVQPNPPARATVRIPPNSGKLLVEIMMVAEK